MAESSLELDARTRKNLATILQGLASVGQSVVAQALGVSESTISRMKEKELPELAKFLALIGRKAVPVEMKCYRPDAIAAIFTLARMTVENNDAQSLVWDEEK